MLPRDESDTLDMLGKILQQTRRRARGRNGFQLPTSGAAAAFQTVLLDPLKREELLQEAPFRRFVEDGDWKDEEHCARSLAIGFIIGNLAHMIDAVALKKLAQFQYEKEMAQMLRGLGAAFRDDADRSAWKAAQHRLTAELIHASARYIGFALERDFGVRAPRFVAETVTRAFGLTPAMNERQARYLCGWEQATTPPKLLR